jgi:hypothetical protein
LDHEDPAIDDEWNDLGKDLKDLNKGMKSDFMSLLKELELITDYSRE